MLLTCLLISSIETMPAGQGRDNVTEFLRVTAGPQPGSMKYREEIMNMPIRPNIVGMLPKIRLESV
jgi:hypothetical protein